MRSRLQEIGEIVLGLLGSCSIALLSCRPFPHGLVVLGSADYSAICEKFLIMLRRSYLVRRRTKKT